MIENFIKKLKNETLTTLEITPPKSPNIEGVIKKVEELNLDKIDAFVVTDNALAKMKYCSILASIKIQERFQKPVVTTMSMRDKNIIALQSSLLGANDFDIRIFLALTGDGARMSDQVGAKGVFEGNSIKLLQTIKSLNAGIDYSGKELKGLPKRIYALSVINSNAKNIQSLKKKIEKKIEAGSCAIVTQPIYDIEIAKRLKSIVYECRERYQDERRECEIVFGIFPIFRFKTAQFLSSHVPGIYIPQNIIDRLHKASLSDSERDVGFEISRAIVDEIRYFHPKIHIMVANSFCNVNALLE